MDSVINGVEENWVSVQKKAKSIPLSYYPKEIIEVITFKAIKQIQTERRGYCFIILGRGRS